MSDIPTARRQLKIKSGVVKRYANILLWLKTTLLILLVIRLSKEHALYRKEAEQQQRKLDKFIADGAEGWDINNGVRELHQCPKNPTPANDFQRRG